MAPLTQGQPLPWDEIKKYSRIVQDMGVKQFIRLYSTSKNRADGQFKWGDEIEYELVKYNHQARIAQLNLSAERVFKQIEDHERKSKIKFNSLWHPEFGAYMLEGTPKLPFDCDGDLIGGLCKAELNMRERRRQVLSVLEPDEGLLTLTNFPRHGCLGSSWPVHYPNPQQTKCKSNFIPDEVIFAGHPRFMLLARNIMSRRQSKVAINVPIYFDINTPRPFVENFPDIESRKAAKPNHIYMDSLSFGMGCCCLQITLQATHLKEAKTLYDQMIPLAPIMAALSASSPAFRGFLTERDHRWNVIVDACDDRTVEERSELGKDLDGNKVRITKSRYASVSSYLSCPGQAYNDIPLVYDRDYFNFMIAQQVELPIARHIAHLFVREPIALYREKIHQTVDNTDHWDNIQSSNWQTLRFKPPPTLNSPIGWRVEFRPLEVQITDFENAAYSVFIILLSRVILAYKLNFLMPISLVDANMEEAQKRDAVLESIFWFRKTITQKSQTKPLCNRVTNSGISNGVKKCFCQQQRSLNVNGNRNSNNINNNRNNNSNNIINSNAGNNDIMSGNNNRSNGVNGGLMTDGINNGSNNNNIMANDASDSLISPSSSTTNSILNNNNINNLSMRSPTNKMAIGNNNNNNNNNNNINNMITNGIVLGGNNHQYGRSNYDRLVMSTPATPPKIEEYASQMSINEIINGSDRFVGLIPIVQHYVDSMSDGSNTQQIAQIKQYLRFLSDRASGRIKTTAKFMRDFIRSHPDYRWDSVVSEPINHDLIVFLDRVSKGEIRCPELLGDTRFQL